MQAIKAQQLANQLMKEHGLYPQWSFQFTNAVRIFGSTNFNKRLIKLSRVLTEINDEEHVRDTILHEIAHALAGPGIGHGPTWKQIAIEIGCNGQRTFSSKIVNTPQHRWTGTCPTCDRKIKRHIRMDICCGKCSRFYDPKNAFIYTENPDYTNNKA
jgi:predicted SprT family Zn-dependent metalloprotease